MLNYESIKELIIYLCLNPFLLFTLLGIEIFLILLTKKFISHLSYYYEGRKQKHENN